MLAVKKRILCLAGNGNIYPVQATLCIPTLSKLHSEVSLLFL